MKKKKKKIGKEREERLHPCTATLPEPSLFRGGDEWSTAWHPQPLKMASRILAHQKEEDGSGYTIDASCDGRAVDRGKFRLTTLVCARIRAREGS